MCAKYYSNQISHNVLMMLRHLFSFSLRPSTSWLHSLGQADYWSGQKDTPGASLSVGANCMILCVLRSLNLKILPSIIHYVEESSSPHNTDQAGVLELSYFRFWNKLSEMSQQETYKSYDLVDFPGMHVLMQYLGVGYVPTFQKTMTWDILFIFMTAGKSTWNLCSTLTTLSGIVQYNHTSWNVMSNTYISKHWAMSNIM
jgi:hypothetical protein